jgi:hypothetical protein
MFMPGKIICFGGGGVLVTEDIIQLGFSLFE